jgi:uncharacterized protein
MTPGGFSRSLRHLFVFLMAVALYSHPALPATAAEVSSEPPARNAALQYWRAFQWNQVELEDWDPAEIRRLADETFEGRFNESTELFFSRMEPYLSLLRRGADQPYCHWGIVEGPVRPVDVAPQLNMRSLLRLGIAQFRYLSHLGRSPEAADLLKDLFRAARHIDDGSLSLGFMVRISSEALLMTVAAGELPALDREPVQNLAVWWERQDWSVAPVRLSRTFHQDHALNLRFFGELVESPEFADQDVAVLKKALNEAGLPLDLADPAALREFVSALTSEVDRVTRAMNTATLAEARDNLRQLEAPAGFPFENQRFLIESAESMVQRAQRAELLARMFREALSRVAAIGPELETNEEFSVERQFRDRFLLRPKTEDAALGGVRLQVGRLSSLPEAAAAGDLEQVEHLVRSGTKVHLTDRQGWTALHHAAQAGHGAVVKFLLENGADLHAPTLSGSNAHHMDPVLARRYGLEVKPAEPGPDARTALDLARQQGHEDLARFLESRGARPAASPGSSTENRAD